VNTILYTQLEGECLEKQTVAGGKKSSDSTQHNLDP